MLLFAHTGITLGLGWLIKDANSGKADAVSSGSILPAQEQHPGFEKSSSESVGARLMKLGARMDLRVLVVGAMLPDIVDKPLGQVILRDSVNNGRIFCHTLLFLIIITLVGLYLYRSRGRLWMLTLSFGTLVHLILDEMWLMPRTVLWPLYGWSFPKSELTVAEWTQALWEALFTDPVVYIAEIIGLIVLVCFAVVLLRKKKVRAFLRQGRVYD